MSDKNILNNNTNPNYDSVNDDKCYLCLENTGKLVRPCSNNNCKSRAHRNCLKDQIEKQTGKNKGKCGVCKSTIVKTKNNFNEKRCCTSTLKVVYVLLLTIVGSVLTFMMALGKTINNKWVSCSNGDKDVHPCDDGAVGTIFYTIPFVFLFYQYHLCKCGGRACGKYSIFCCDSIKDKLKYKTYITMFVMFLISNCLIFLAHGIGYPIIKHMFHMDVFFTWRTSLAGFIVYTIILTAIMIISLIGCTSMLIINCIKDEFTEFKYGADSDNEIIGETVEIV